MSLLYIHHHSVVTENDGKWDVTTDGKRRHQHPDWSSPFSPYVWFLNAFITMPFLISALVETAVRKSKGTDWWPTCGGPSFSTRPSSHRDENLPNHPAANPGCGYPPDELAKRFVLFPEKEAPKMGFNHEKMGWLIFMRGKHHYKNCCVHGTSNQLSLGQHKHTVDPTSWRKNCWLQVFNKSEGKMWGGGGAVAENRHILLILLDLVGSWNGWESQNKICKWRLRREKKDQQTFTVSETLWVSPISSLPAQTDPIQKSHVAMENPYKSMIFAFKILMSAC